MALTRSQIQALSIGFLVVLLGLGAIMMLRQPSFPSVAVEGLRAKPAPYAGASSNEAALLPIPPNLLNSQAYAWLKKNAQRTQLNQAKRQVMLKTYETAAAAEAKMSSLGKSSARQNWGYVAEQHRKRFGWMRTDGTYLLKSARFFLKNKRIPPLETGNRWMTTV